MRDASSMDYKWVSIDELRKGRPIQVGLWVAVRIFFKKTKRKLIKIESLQSNFFPAKIPFSKIQKKNLAGKKITLQMNEVQKNLNRRLDAPGPERRLAILHPVPNTLTFLFESHDLHNLLSFLRFWKTRKPVPKAKHQNLCKILNELLHNLWLFIQGRFFENISNNFLLIHEEISWSLFNCWNVEYLELKTQWNFPIQKVWLAF